MKGPATLALVLAPRVDAGVEEFVRLCVGLVAGGGHLVLLQAGAGAGLLGRADDLPEEVERGLEGLAGFGVVPWTPDPGELRDQLRASARVLCVSDPARPGRPDVLVVDDAWLEATPPAALVAALATAGQVVRDPRRP